MTNAVVGSLMATLGLDIAQYSSGLSKAQAESKRSIGLMAAGFAGFAGGIAAAIGGEAVNAFKTFSTAALNSADDIQDASNLMGIATENLQALKIAFQNAGAEPEVFDEAMVKLNKNLGDFKQTGGGAAASAFKELGLSGQIASGAIKGTDQVFLAVTKAMEGVTDPAVKAALSAKLFGKSAGTDMVEVLGAGEAALNSYANAAKASGQVFTQADLDKLNTYRQNLKDMQTEVGNMATVFTGKATIAIGDFAVKMQPVFEQVKQIGKQIADFLMPSLSKMGAAFMELAQNQAFIDTLKVIGAVVGGVVVLSIKAMAEGLTLVYKAVNALFNAFASLGSFMQSLSKTFSNLGKNIVDGLVKGFDSAKSIAMQAISDLGANIIKAFKTILGIHSPSKVFEEFGINTGEGYIIGIESMLGGVDATINKLGGGAIQKMAELQLEAANNYRSLLTSLMTDEERASKEYADNLKILDDQFKLNQISGAEYAAVLERIQNVRNATRSDVLDLSKTKEMPSLPDFVGAEDLPQVIADAANDNKTREAFQTMFSGGIKAAMGDNKDYFKNLWQDILNKAMNNVLNNISGTIFDIFTGSKSGGGSGGGILDFVKSIFSSSPKNAQGGSYGFKGGGGVDSKLFTSWVSPSEIVKIGHPSDFENNGSYGAANLNVYLGNELLDSRIIDLSTNQSISVTGAAQSAINTTQKRAASYGL